MRSLAIGVVGLLALTALPAPAQDSSRPVEYRVDVDQRSLFSRIVEREGRGRRRVSVQFQIKRLSDNLVVTTIPKEEIVVEEDGIRVADIEILQPRAQKLTTVLAMDVSGSMARNHKIDAAKQAALAFLDKMDDRADVGLILFDHVIQLAAPPVGDPARLRAHREKIRKHIQEARPMGGTAYHDATIEAVKMLHGIAGRRAVVLMTDGADTNSKESLARAIAIAKTEEVPVYTLGIGEPGKNDPVTTVLVLDRSGSMLAKADEMDKLTKLDALKRAANRFVDLMRTNAKTTLLPFSDDIDKPEPFTNELAVLRSRIEKLNAHGGTRLYDATYSALETLEAGGVKGKRAVVVLTDGTDEAPGSRESDDEVIKRAKELDIPLYMLGLGRPEEINEPVMKKMAKETKGDYYHAGNERKLLELFENLSIELHDDGIDETSLRALAEQTGGKYRHVSKISELQFIYEQLADELQTTYQVSFDSNRSSQDGTARAVDVKIVRQGMVVSTVGKVDDIARGVVVPQMSYQVYLVFLLALGGLLAFPTVVKRMYKAYGGT